jgi:hypothetical protein
MSHTFTWKPVTFAIHKFYEYLSPASDKRIECDPVGQRPDVESLDKKQGIVDTIIRGYDFGELKLRTLSDEVVQSTTFKFRSIDGGHRKRAIRDFMEGKFKTHRDTVSFVDGKEVYCGNMFYRDLPETVRTSFNNYEMRFTVYSVEMTDEDAGETFRRTNITTDVNHQEMLNSYEDNLVARYVRETSRPIPGLNNRYHPLFEYTSLAMDDRKQKLFRSPSNRLRDDRFVTRLLAFFYKINNNQPNVMAHTDKELEDIWVKLGNTKDGDWLRDSKLVKKYQEQIKDALDFLMNYSIIKKDNSKYGMTDRDVALMIRLYSYLYREHGKNFRVKDYEKLYNSVRNALDKFIGSDEKNLRQDLHKDNKGVRTVCECFAQYLTVHQDEYRAEQSIKWLLEEMDINHCGIVFLDPVRVFTADMIEQKWRQNGGVCEITGKELKLSDAAGAHIIAHSEGGWTRMANLMVCHKDLNSKMGSTNALDFKKIYQDNLTGVELPEMGVANEL